MEEFDFSDILSLSDKLASIGWGIEFRQAYHHGAGKAFGKMSIILTKKHLFEDEFQAFAKRLSAYDFEPNFDKKFNLIEPDDHYFILTGDELCFQYIYLHDIAPSELLLTYSTKKFDLFYVNLLQDVLGEDKV